MGYAFALCFSAIGSAFGTSAAGMAAIACWKKCFLTKKSARFLLFVFVGAPLSQTIYGMILMNALIAASGTIPPLNDLAIGVAGGLAIGTSSWLQGRTAALAADAITETDKGFGNYLMVLGIIETVALFVMVFLMTSLKN